MKTIIIDGIEYNLTPKVLFKKGDFVVIQETTYLISKIEGINVTLFCNGRECLFDIDVLKNARLWDITRDAKKGDILACGKCILIFDQLSEFNNEQVLMDICHCTSKGFYWQDTKDRDLWALDGFKPATKEQRDTLFAKMREAGYEWDAEKKELKKISQRMISAEAKEAMYGKPTAWSENDEYIIERLSYLLDNEQENYPQLSCDFQEIQEFKDWLKSLKQRIKL